MNVARRNAGLFTGVMASLVFSLAQAETAAPAPLSASQIMDKVSAIDSGDNLASTVTMTITDAKGYSTEGVMRTFKKKFVKDGAEETRSIMFFTSPSNFKGISFFSIDYLDPAKGDDRYLYTPALNKTKKVASRDKRLSFMSSDFSYADMDVHNPERYKYRIDREEVLDGHKCWVIEGTPVDEKSVDEDGYTKSLFFVRQDNFVTVRTINHVKRGDMVKQMDITKLEQVNGLWIPMEIVMKTQKSGVTLGHTSMKVSDLLFDQKYNESFFSTRQMMHAPE